MGKLAKFLLRVMEVIDVVIAGGAAIWLYSNLSNMFTGVLSLHSRHNWFVSLNLAVVLTVCGVMFMLIERVMALVEPNPVKRQQGTKRLFKATAIFTIVSFVLVLVYIAISVVLSFKNS